MSENKVFEYQLLDRLRTDCEYFLGAGKGHEKHLWADNVTAQIDKMKELYNGFSKDEKPEWLSMDDILDYEKRMSELKNVNEHLRELQIRNFECDGEGYLHFTIIADGYQLDGLYRIHDPANGDSLKLVSIDYGYLHPVIAKKWNEIERVITEYSKIFNTDEYAAAQAIEVEKKEITIDGIDCYKLDEWQKGTVHFILGRDKNNDLEWYMVQVTESLKGFEDTYTQEYDRRPSREAIEKSHKDIIDAIAKDNHKAKAKSNKHDQESQMQQENQKVNFARRRGR